MNLEVETKPIAIHLNTYNQHIAKLIEQLLFIDEKMYPSQILTQSKGA